MPQTPHHHELFPLLAALCDDTIRADQGQRLAEILRTDRSARLIYVRYMDLHSSLGDAGKLGQWWLPAPGERNSRPATEATHLLPDALFVRNGAARPAERPSGFLDGDHRPHRLWGRKRPEARPSLDDTAAGTADGTRRPAWRVGVRRIWKVATLAAVLLAAAWGVVRYRGTATPSAGQSQPRAAVAELQSEHQCTWIARQVPLGEGTSFYSGQRFELASGVAKLQFGSGATVLIESPAAFELVSETALRLERGTVAVRANGPIKEFVVYSPDASIVDLGTSFGVHCGDDDATEVEVFEGAVEILPGRGAEGGRVLGMGASARIYHHGETTDIDMFATEKDRYTNLLQLLWADMRLVEATPDADHPASAYVEAEFDDAPVPHTVDTFYGAVSGRGWLTPWVAVGNPLGEIRRDASLRGDNNQYLCVKFFRSSDRAIAREYGRRQGFDPAQPHVISWHWRFDGVLDQYGDHFDDRIYFYGNPYFRRNSWPDNSWLIGWVGANERKNKHRRVYPKHWYVFDGSRDDEFERRNMVDTGMPLKAGVVYRFAVVIYPEEARYDVAIRDDETTFMRTGLAFRGKSTAPANVVHFGLSADDSMNNACFSLDSVRIEPLVDGTLLQKLQFGEESPSVDHNASAVLADPAKPSNKPAAQSNP